MRNGFVILLLITPAAMAQTDDQVALSMGNAFYSNNNTYTDASVHAWQTATPASQNMNAATLNAGANHLASQSKSASLLVARGSRLIHESYFHNTTAASAKNIHSASKSILATLTGVAIHEDRLTLDTRLGDVLPHSMPADKQGITVAHLLGMRSGIQWEEDDTEYGLSGNFVQSILNLPQAHAPGTTFNYSTGDAYLMGAVLAHATGMSLHQYAKTRLFDPLGINVERWGRDAQGYFTGGHNFYITPREMARFGQLILDRGAHNGEQLVPPAWIDAMTSPHGSPNYYGYYWWLDANLAGHGGFRAWGWGKQFIYVFPNDDLVVVLTHDTKGNVADTDLNQFVRDYVLAAITGPPVSPHLPGDFNRDGQVDAGDYVRWRNGLGAEYTVTDYDTWRDNYGRTAGDSAAHAPSTPEPATWLLLTSAIMMLSPRPRRLPGRLRLSASSIPESRLP